MALWNNPGVRANPTIALTLPKTAAPSLNRFNAAFALCQHQADITEGGTRITLTAEQLQTHPNSAYLYFNSAGNMVARGERTVDTQTFQYRSELRVFPEFSNQNRSRMYAEMKLSNSDLNEYTFMQIHEKPPSGSVPPPLRLAWEKTRTQASVTYNDYLWAVFHRGGSTYERIPLIARPEGFMAVEVECEAGSVYITIDDVLVHSETVEAWDGKDLYFKQGVYCTGSTSSIGVATNETRSLTLVVDEAIPDSVQVTVTGTGFGVAPNVVVYRVAHGAVGESMPAVAPSGQVGEATFTGYGAPTVIELADGVLAYGMHPRTGANAVRSSSFSFNQARRFRVFFNAAVPSDAVMPGSKSTTGTAGDRLHGEFSSDSGLKIAWMLKDSNANADASEADACFWTHPGGGRIFYEGNATWPTKDLFTFTEGQTMFAWNGQLNGSEYIQECDAASPTTVDSFQRVRWTSPAIAGFKTTGTIERTRTRPSFQNASAGTVADGVSDFYAMIKLVPYSQPLDFEPTKTQIAMTDIYVSAESADQQPDWRQCAWLCNASTIEASTRRKAVVADSWTNTSVSVTVSVEDQAWATHVIVEDVDGNETAEAIA